MKPGRELDALVAEKVMGWVKLEAHPAPHTLFHPNFGKPGNPNYAGPWFYHPDWTPEKGGHPNGQVIPAYSTDIAAAWLVVERLGTNFRELVHLRPGWQATVTKANNYYAVADTPALAICLVALKAWGVDTPPEGA